ncbi:hypothetical protein SDC9_34388 [bioreactor metagenome]|uniref:Uncharacterized protein n=1 Tax=bioreactor metagenome TaxID=1076179 RepID=A0A644VAM4_9ZZZZ
MRRDGKAQALPERRHGAECEAVGKQAVGIDAAAVRKLDRKPQAEPVIDHLGDPALDHVFRGFALGEQAHLLGAAAGGDDAARDQRRIDDRAQPAAADLDLGAFALAAQDPAGQEVGGADEIRDIGRGGVVIKLLRAALLGDAALLHHHDAVRHHQRLGLVMGDHDEGDADLLVQVLHLDLHLLAEFRIERRERLVEQQHLRFAHDGAGKGDALALPARELLGTQLHLVEEADELERVMHLGLDLEPAEALDLKPIADVLAHRHVREEGIVLEHHVDLALVGRVPGDVLVGQPDGAGGGRLEAADHPQKRGFPAARGAEQRDEFAVLDRQRDIVHADDRRAVVFGDVLQFDDCGHVAFP